MLWNLNSIKNNLALMMALSILIFTPAWASAFNMARPGYPAYVEGEILVKFKKNTPRNIKTSLHGFNDAKKIKAFRRSGIEHIKLPVWMSVEMAVEQYKRDPNVEYAGPNMIRYSSFISNVPNDSLFTNQWSLDNLADRDVDAPEAWNLTIGVSNVVIAVLDTGMDTTHPDLQGNLWRNTGETNCADGIDNDNNGYIDDCYGWDFVDNDNDPFDYSGFGHGTKVAGIIGADSNNSVGIAGVMWDVQIMPLRFLDATGSGPISDEIAAIEYAMDNGAIVLNASFGGMGFSAFESSTIHDYCLAGGIFVAAAGNWTRDNDRFPEYPASYPESCVISVAATDSNDNLASFSNYGLNSVDLAAPGVAIKSTIPVTANLLPFQDGTETFNSISGWTKGGTGVNTWGVGSSGCRYTNNCLQDSPGGNYTSGLDTWVSSYLIDTSGQTNCTLTYLTKHELNTDTVTVEASANESIWNSIDTFTGSSGGQFTRKTHDVSLYNSNLYIRFGIQTAGTGDGVYFENMQVRCDGPGGRYANGDGTSFAAPIVSGIAGLVRANFPLATVEEIINRVVSSAELVSGPNGRTVTGGRANAMNAMLPIPPNSSGVLTGDTTVSLSWGDVAGEDGYVIERSRASDGVFSVIATLGPDTTSYKDQPLSRRNTYRYKVRSYSGENTSGYSRLLEVETASSGGSSILPCFIATAAWGSPYDGHVNTLREFRDDVLMATPLGRQFVRLYEIASPPVADVIARHAALRVAVRSVLGVGVYLGLENTGAGLALVITVISISGGLYRRRRKDK
jgi:subtilisin family serine protease